jgi:hypothetical protein
METPNVLSGDFVIDRTSAPATVLAPADIVPSKETVANRKQGGRAIVGGIEYTVAGWGEYEVHRRRTRWEVSGGKDAPGGRYRGRTYIHADDAVRSIMSTKIKNVLQTAATKLGDALSRMEDRLCEPSGDGVWECEPPQALGARGHVSYTVPALTSVDLYDFAKDVGQQTDPEYMMDLGNEVVATAAALGVDTDPMDPTPSLPVLPMRAVQVSNDEAVLKLEAAVTSRVTSIEKMQAELATRLDALTSAINSRLPKT